MKRLFVTFGESTGYLPECKFQVKADQISDIGASPFRVVFALSAFG